MKYTKLLILILIFCESAFSENIISQSTNVINISGNINNSNSVLVHGELGIPLVSEVGINTSTTTFAELLAVSATVADVHIFDTKGQKHKLTAFFYHLDTLVYKIRFYANSEDVDPGGSPTTGLPRRVVSSNNLPAEITLVFDSQGELSSVVPTALIDIPWNNGAANSLVEVKIINNRMFLDTELFYSPSYMTMSSNGCAVTMSATPLPTPINHDNNYRPTAANVAVTGGNVLLKFENDFAEYKIRLKSKSREISMKMKSSEITLLKLERGSWTLRYRGLDVDGSASEFSPITAFRVR